MTSARPSAVITGAGSGIGRATAIALAREAFDVLLVGRTAATLRETAALIPSRSIVHTADLSTPEGNRAMVDACVRAFGRLDVLINNAGRAEVASVLESTPELVERVFRINALGPAFAMHYAWPHLMSAAAKHASSGTGEGGGASRFRSGAGGGPVIVNVSSIATVDPFPGFFAYGASKAAVNLLTQSAAKEGAEVGVRVFCVAPGAVETAMLRSAFDESRVPRAQTLSPEAVARVIVECVRGTHDSLAGRVIPLLPESAKAWYREWVKHHPPVSENLA